jgi:hypothetical protein
VNTGVSPEAVTIIILFVLCLALCLNQIGGR